MGQWKDMYTIAQNVIAQKGMNIDLHGEIAKSMSLMNNLGVMQEMGAVNNMNVGAPESAGAPISPPTEQTPAPTEMMPEMG